MILIDRLIKAGIAGWKDTTAYPSLSAWFIEDANRQAYENQLQDIITKVNAFLKAFPNTKKAQRMWKQKGTAELEKIIQNSDSRFFSGLKEQERQLFQSITISFLRDVREFDSTLSLQDTMQALRNVWIIAILQCLFQKYSGYHQAMFAYSMLYPYSDNYLDAPTITLQEKQQFNCWFTKRLKGETSAVHNEREQKIAALIEIIEARFPRKKYPDVYEALLLIQAAQIHSLRQQDGAQILSDDQLLTVSYQKGGTSVVADGMLIDGSLNDEQLQFCMQFGFLLQLGDDVQDGSSDHKNAHQTLLSNHIDQNADAFIYKLLQYINDVFMHNQVCQRKELLHFVQKDCCYLIFYALMQNDAIAVSQALKKDIQHCLPLSRAFLFQQYRQYGNDYDEAALWERIDALL